MSLVYRVVPSSTATFIRTKNISVYNINLESEFYDMGYLDFENSALFFKNPDLEDCNTFEYTSETTKAFFLFPIDAIVNTFRSINGFYYSRREWKVLEYNIPDEILKEYCGYGFYQGKARIEFRIPISEFKKYTPEEPKELDETMLYEHILEENDKIIEAIEFSEEDKQILEIIRPKLPLCAKKAIEGRREYLKCPFITNNNFLVTLSDIYKKEKNQYISLEEMLCLLKSKINVSDNTIDVWKSLEKSSDDVYSYWKYYRNEEKAKLQGILDEVFPLLKNEEKQKKYNKS